MGDKYLERIRGERGRLILKWVNQDMVLVQKLQDRLMETQSMQDAESLPS